MTDYEYANLPDNLYADPIPEELFEDGRQALYAALESDLVIAKDIKVGYVYNRNDVMEFDAFGTPRNRSYSSSSDDIVIQLTVRIDHPRHGEAGEEIFALENKVAGIVEEAKREFLRAEIRSEEAKLASVQETLRKRKESLEALNAKK